MCRRKAVRTRWFRIGLYCRRAAVNELWSQLRPQCSMAVGASPCTVLIRMPDPLTAVVFHPICIVLTVIVISAIPCRICSRSTPPWALVKPVAGSAAASASIMGW